MSRGIRAFRESDAREINDMVPSNCDHTMRENFVNAWKGGLVAYTICFPGTDSPMACISGAYLFSGCLKVWALVDSEIQDFPIYYAKQARRLCDLVFTKWKLNRCEITIRCDQGWAQNWARFLGFELEGRMKMYGEDAKDYFLFARVRQ